MIELTKAQHFSLPKDGRRRRKDGTHWVRSKTTGEWLRVYWRR